MPCEQVELVLKAIHSIAKAIHNAARGKPGKGACTICTEAETDRAEEGRGGKRDGELMDPGNEAVQKRSIVAASFYKAQVLQLCMYRGTLTYRIIKNIL
jgi:hypothetical protein